MSEPSLQIELESLLNRHSVENESNTPDFILAGYLLACLNAFDAAVQLRSAWYGKDDRITFEPELEPRPERTPEMKANGQGWTWINGEWQVKGTGAVPPAETP